MPYNSPQISPFYWKCNCGEIFPNRCTFCSYCGLDRDEDDSEVTIEELQELKIRLYPLEISE